MRTIEDLKGDRVHTRHITIESFSAPDGIVIQGRLHDQRLADTFTMTGARRPPGTVHHMVLRLHVTGPPLKVAAAEVELPGVPYDECRETAGSLQALVDMPIAAGFTAAVKRRLGGARGCAHLTALLLAMAPAAVQGFWALKASTPVQLTAVATAAMERYLIDTCRVWRRDGPRAQALLDAAAQEQEAGGDRS